MRILRDGVGIFTERGGSIGYMTGKDGIVVIDAQFPDTVQHLIEEIKKQNSTAPAMPQPKQKNSIKTFKI